MFSDHLSIIEEAPTKTLLMIAAGLVIVCQLVAMVMVADGQVEKAQLREARQASARAATVWCLESSRGAALKDCDHSSSPTSAQLDADKGNPTSQGLTLVTLGNRY